MKQAFVMKVYWWLYWVFLAIKGFGERTGISLFISLGKAGGQCRLFLYTLRKT